MFGMVHRVEEEGEAEGVAGVEVVAKDGVEETHQGNHL